MSKIEIIQSRRAAAIQTFLSKNGDTYLRMINKIKKILGTYIGFERVNSSLAAEIMNEIFSDLIDGTRTWDMEILTLEKVLWKNVNSEISNFVKKEKRYTLTPSSNDDVDNDMDTLISTQPEDIEGNIDAEAIEAHCFDVIFKDDMNAQIILNEMLKGIKQKEIAEDLGMNLNEVKVIIRNIKRNISKKIPYHLIKNLPEDLIDKILKQT